MEAFALSGMLISLIFMVVPIVAAVFLLVWVYQTKVNSEKQVMQNERVIKLLEELTMK
ncbi:hypothetical protein [Ornithinibacillus halotolerans]|uniref:DUF4083 domain-containing protein n=1 Tax=Ornithinibacillus halotolerans TaxID=1274357 RepID=A0A916RTM0_9BACI|nr:hypothetical protein [Ornithinibacillus halotolerans]GGA66745.1 hypothetical protein GCM10008025_08280 [Ornithinibacillus halotolerans]